MKVYIHTHHMIMDSIWDLLGVIQNPTGVSRSTSFKGLSVRPRAVDVVCLFTEDAE